ncbi:MAG: M23 family metallopeptidase [Spirochaetes bacterium]|nr:M23 family metallopeptidase [Spirochaetota bacterium]
MFAILSLSQIPVREIPDREYLISGQNTVQKIYYQTSSRYSRIHSGRMAMDSDRDTSWISEKSVGPHWIEIDFGIKRLMSSIIVHVGRKNNYRTVRTFTLQFLHQGVWFDFATVNCERRSFFGTRYNDTITIDLGGVDASTFRIYIPPGGTYNGYAAISEIEAYVGTGRIRYYDERLKGLCFPIENGYLPEADESYPNAPRKYRGGRHVGLDIYYYHKDNSYDPLPVTKDTPVLAADDGEVIRVDRDYKALTVSEWKAQSQYYQNNPHTFDARSFGGRQVWIDHKNGVVTTYNHLSRIASGIRKGSSVSKGERIGWVGNSGLLGEAEGRQYGTHLHFEIWVDSYYLGCGMALPEIKNYLTWIFFPMQ